MADENPVPDLDAIADERMALDLAAGADYRAPLDLDEGSDPRVVPDLAPVEIRERPDGDVLAEVDVGDLPKGSLVCRCPGHGCEDGTHATRGTLGGPATGSPGGQPGRA